MIVVGDGVFVVVKEVAAKNVVVNRSKKILRFVRVLIPSKFSNFAD